MSRFLSSSKDYLNRNFSNYGTEGQRAVLNGLIDPTTGKLPTSIVPAVGGTSGVYVVSTYQELDDLTGLTAGAIALVSNQNVDETFIYDSDGNWVQFSMLPTSIQSLSDVSIATITKTEGDHLMLDSNLNWTNVQYTPSILQCADVNLTLPLNDGEVLKFDSGSNAWVNSPDATGNNTLAGLDDVNTTGQGNNYNVSYSTATSNYVMTPSVLAKGDLLGCNVSGSPIRVGYNGVNDQVLTTDTSTTSGFKWATPATPALSALSDTTITTPSNGQALIYETASSKWKNTTLATPKLSEMGDVFLNTLTSGQVLTYDEGIYAITGTQLVLMTNILTGANTVVSTIISNAMSYAYSTAGKFHLLLSNTQISKSFDLVNWTTVNISGGTNLPSIFTGSIGFGEGSLLNPKCMVYSAYWNRFIIVNSGATSVQVSCAYSTDGITWTGATGFVGTCYGLIENPANGMLFSQINNPQSGRYSIDGGTSWLTTNTDARNNYFGGCYAFGRFYQGGETSYYTSANPPTSGWTSFGGQNFDYTAGKTSAGAEMVVSSNSQIYTINGTTFLSTGQSYGSTPYTVQFFDLGAGARWWLMNPNGTSQYFATNDILATPATTVNFTNRFFMKFAVWKNSLGFNPSTSTIKIGLNAGSSNTGTKVICIGDTAGQTGTGSNGICIGSSTVGSVSPDTVSIGRAAGGNTTGNRTGALAIGVAASNNSPNAQYSVSIGNLAGQNTQGNSTVAIGNQAAFTAQANGAVAIGENAGYSTQGDDGIAIGHGSGRSNQAVGAIAIGSNAGYAGQGLYAVAIGVHAGNSSGFATAQHARTIVLNASGPYLNSAQSDSTYIAPIRSNVGTNVLKYNTTTKEITYDPLNEFTADNFRLKDQTDTTKKIAFNLANQTTATTRTITLPAESGTIVYNLNTASLENKTITHSSNSVRATQLAYSGGSIDLTASVVPTNNQIPQYKTTGNTIDWIPLELNSLLDTANNGAFHGQALVYDVAANKFTNEALVWKDMLGEITLRAGGGANPFSVAEFITGYFDHATATGNGATSEAYLSFHPNHDYALGTDMFIHAHIATNAVSTGNVVFVVSASFAQSGSVFPAMKTIGNISKTFAGAGDQYRHFVIEIQLSTAGGGANQLDTNLIDTDGKLLVKITRTQGANGDTMASTHQTFLFGLDIHYQAVSEGTLNKVAPFRS